MLCAPTVSLIHYKPPSELSEPLLLSDKSPSELSESLLLSDKSPSDCSESLLLTDESPSDCSDLPLTHYERAADCSATLSLSPLIIREIKVIDLFFKRINHLSLSNFERNSKGCFYSLVEMDSNESQLAISNILNGKQIEQDLPF